MADPLAPHDAAAPGLWRAEIDRPPAPNPLTTPTFLAWEAAADAIRRAYELHYATGRALDLDAADPERVVSERDRGMIARGVRSKMAAGRVL